VASGGQFVQFATPSYWPRYSDTAGWHVFCIAFYLIFGLLLLNIFLAIIVDTFSELRDGKKEADQAKANSCYVCSIERETFKRKGVGKFFKKLVFTLLDFVSHITSDHNIFHYLYFFAYVKDQKAKGELSPVEKYIAERVLYFHIYCN
jgi:hypothetical protein